MKKICLVGDSHIATLQSATKNHEIRDRYDLTFFACHLTLAPGLSLNGTRIVPKDARLSTLLQQFSGGLDNIDINGYDSFVICGFGLAMTSVVALYRYYISDSMTDRSDSKYLVSDDCFQMMARKASEACEAVRVAMLIRSVCDKPVTIASVPKPGLGLPEEKIPDWYPPCHAALRNGDDQILSRAFVEACTMIASGCRLRVIPPLPEVEANGVFNRREYSWLPENIDEESDESLLNGMVHGNDQYGLHLARHVFGEYDPISQ